MACMMNMFYSKAVVANIIKRLFSWRPLLDPDEMPAISSGFKENRKYEFSRKCE